ncbi:hydrogenase [Hydrogenimonas urashimensis]|uniref:hydrogenase n=1 Tax=Hydrogenimonas urashimensis TaxID=2740515 RepID=UPI001916366A|nr:hydrogenase [Hydrogenimonas urashimensis]
MSIVQTIEYKIEHRYFTGFLQHAIDETGVKGSVEQKEGVITLILDESDAEALERFSNYTQKYLPHSIFLGEITTRREDREPAQSRFHSPVYPIAPCPLCLEEITDPASDRYLDDTVRCTHYANDAVFEDRDPTCFSPHCNGNDTVLLCDATKARELFLATDEELKALFSIEKPTLKLTVKDPELQAMTGQKFLRIKAPYNVKSVLAALNAKESGISTLFFNERPNEPTVVLVQEHLHMVYDNRISAPLKNLHADPVLNRFVNVAKEANANQAVGAYLSRNRGISFPVLINQKVKKALEFPSFELQTTLKTMLTDKTRCRLLENFTERYPDESEILSGMKTNDLFEAIMAVMGQEDGSFAALNDLALEFHGNGGLKIDMNFGENGFDYAAMLGSIMSFRLAGAEPHYLAYSIFEAFGDMTISVLGQLKREFKIDKFLLMGDFFESTVLFSRVLSKFQISKPYFSTRIALDG